MSLFTVRIFPLTVTGDLNKAHALFDQRGQPVGVDLQYMDQTELERSEDQLYASPLPAPGAYWLVHRHEGGSDLGKVTASETEESVIDVIFTAMSPRKDEETAAAAGVFVQHEVPEPVIRAFLDSLGRESSQAYLRPSAPPTAGDPPKVTDADHLRARRH